MDFYHFLKREHPDFGVKLISIACAAGVINSLLAAILVMAAGEAAPNELNFQSFMMFALALVGFLYAKKFTLDKTAEIVEAVLETIRVRISKKVCNTNLKDFESIGSSQLYNVLTADTQILSQSSGMIINAASGAIMVLFASFFIFYLSTMAFIMTLVMLGAIILFYFNRRKMLDADIAKASLMETQYFEALNDLLSGFKELKLDKNKSREFFAERISKLSQDVLTLKVNTNKNFNQVAILSQIFFYVLLAALVYIIPNVSPGEIDIIIPVTTVILFIVGPITEVVGIGPFLAKSTASIKNIYRIENLLDANQNGLVEQSTYTEEFSELSLKGCAFSYQQNESHHGFQLGPVDFTLKKGEIVFIIGGNGCGKSTFLKIFTSLYKPHAGEIHYNGRLLGMHEIESYRSLFSTILTDFHLFDKLYGVEDFDQKEAHDLIRSMEIDHVTDINDKKVSNRRLSTGQRKRLALVLSRLEHKEIFIFDEWAADQDPQFRKHFYYTILPELKKAGKTVLAVTHDDNYFDAADRVLKMEFGQFVPYQA